MITKTETVWAVEYKKGHPMRDEWVKYSGTKPTKKKIREWGADPKSLRCMIKHTLSYGGVLYRKKQSPISKFISDLAFTIKSIIRPHRCWND